MSTPCLNAVFICKHCQKLCLCVGNKWQITISSSTSFQDEFEQVLKFITGTNKKALELSEGQFWACQSSFDSSIIYCQQHLSKYSYDFPACSNCMDKVLNKIIQEKQFITRETEFIKTQMPIAKGLLQELHNDIDAAKEDVQVLRDVANSPTKSSKVFSFRNQQNFSDDDFDFSISQRQMHILNASFGSITTITAFTISTKRHYGTINDCRIGTGTPGQVPFFEIDLGFHFLGQLLYFFRKMLSLDNSMISIGSGFILYDKYRHEVPFSCGELKGRAFIESFNRNLHYIVQLCDEVFSKIAEISPQFTTPMIVDLNQRTIGCSSYVYNKKFPQIWTNSMKYLLFNFKFLQSVALRAGVERILSKK